jgi:hypothetical protein
MSSRTGLVLVCAAASSAVLAAAGGVLLLTRGGSGSAATPQITVPAAVQRFPSPPEGAFVLAHADGASVLALAARRQAGTLLLQASEIDQNGDGSSGLHVSFAVASKQGTVTRSAAACGPGCYRATLGLASPPLRVRVRVAHVNRTTSWDVALPASWPAKDATAILARASRVWRQLRSLRFAEHLASDPVHSVDSRWQIVAPDRLAYQVQGQGQAVIVGLHRWDRQKAGAWVRSSAIRLQQPQPTWVEVRNAHVLGTGTLHGHRVWRISFFDPRTPGWFLVAVDRTSYRTLDVQMKAAAHFMHDSYGSFNTSIKIAPPPSG